MTPYSALPGRALTWLFTVCGQKGREKHLGCERYCQAEALMSIRHKQRAVGWAEGWEHSLEHHVHVLLSSSTWLLLIAGWIMTFWKDCGHWASPVRRYGRVRWRQVAEGGQCVLLRWRIPFLRLSVPDSWVLLVNILKTGIGILVMLLGQVNFNLIS